jgi:hypothetical protein
MKKSLFAVILFTALVSSSLYADINLSLDYQGSPYQANLALNTPVVMVTGVNNVNVSATMLAQDSAGATVCLTFTTNMNGRVYKNNWPNYQLTWGTPVGATDLNGDPIWTLEATPLN